MARQFLYDTLFFRNTRAHCMITVLLDTWPEVFMHPNEPSDLLFETILWVIFNSGPANSLQDMKVPEVKEKLRHICGILRPNLSGDDLIKRLLEKAQEYHDNKLQRYYVTKSLLLISRVEDFQWSHNHIIVRLFDVLATSIKGRDQKSKNILHWVVDTIAQVSRCYPQDSREKLLDIFTPLKALITEETIDAELEETCIRAIIWTGHHLQVQVCQFLQEWKPKFKLRPEMEEFIANFIGTRARKFAERTHTISKLAQNRIRRNKYDRVIK